MRSLISKIASHISRTNSYTKEQEEQIEYALKVMLFETLKIIGTVSIFSVCGYGLSAIIAVAVMAISKPFIGGYHEDNQIKCFIATLAIIGSVVYLGLNVEMNLPAKLILNFMSLYCIGQQAPVINAKMPITRKELIRRNRTVGIITIVIAIIASLTLNVYSMISNTIVWMIVFQALFMFNKTIKNRVE